MNALPRFGMGESEAVGVEAKAIDFWWKSHVAAILEIAQDGMSHLGEVDAELMGPSCFRVEFE